MKLKQQRIQQGSKMRFQRYLWIIIFLSATQAGYAQRTLEEQINVVRAYRPVLAEAVKIRKNPELSDTNQVRPQLDYLRSEEHTSELKSLMRTSYAVFCLKK